MCLQMCLCVCEKQKSTEFLIHELWRSEKQMSSIGCCAGNKHALLLVTAPCRASFTGARRAPMPRVGSCRAEEKSANKQQNVKDQLGEDVMRRLKEAEEEAAALRKQLAAAKEKAQVTACILPAHLLRYHYLCVHCDDLNMGNSVMTKRDMHRQLAMQSSCLQAYIVRKHH